MSVVKKKIGVIAPEGSGWHGAAYSGVRDFFKKNCLQPEAVFRSEVDLYSIPCDSQVLENILLWMESKGYDVLITLGSWASIESQILITENDLSFKQFFCGVHQPEKGPLSQIPGVTGIVENHKVRIETLKALFPHINTVSFVYVEESRDNQDSYTKRFERDFASDISKLHLACNKNEVEVKEFPLSIREGPISRQASGVKGIVCLFRDACMFNTAPELISLCNNNDMPLYASELSSVYQGVGLGFGDTGYEYGWRSAELVHKYLLEKKEYSSIGINMFQSSGKLRINNDCIGRQGLHFDQRTLQLIHASTVC